jgi:uncharacterized cupredoxin-like copper-binding protein
MRRTRSTAAALTLALSLVAAACGGGSSAGDAAGGGEGEQAAAGPATVSVTLTDFKIDPNPLTATAGSAITFDIANDGQSPHTFAVMAPDQTYETAEIQAGGSTSLEIPALDAGDYEVLCTVPGHDQLGMVATLSVSDAGAGTTTDGVGSDTLAASPSSEAHHLTPEEMAKGHEQGILDFVGQIDNGPLTDTAGNQPLEPEMDGNVKVFNLTATELEWEVAPGEMKSAMAFNGQVPGPLITVKEGDKVRFEVQNQMTEPLTVHFHGLTVPNDQDGVPYVTQPPIMPGEYWTYEFTIKDPPGMYVYHSHFNSAEQVGKGLYGALNIEPKSGGWASVYGVEPDVEFTMFPGDGPLGYNINGKSFPATEPIVAKRTGSPWPPRTGTRRTRW